MKAAVIYEHGGPGSIRVESGYADPKPAPDEAVLRVKATSLNYHDIFTRRGMPGIKIPMPAIMGIDFAGEIVGLGSEVSGWRIGVQLAKIAGAEVIACASSEAKLERLKSLGADHLIDYKKQDFVQWVFGKFSKPHRRHASGGVDMVVNFTGGETWVPSLKVLRRHGKLLNCGATAGFDPKEDLRYIWSFELKVLGSNGWTREDLIKLFDLIGSGRLTPVIDKALPLTEVNEAFRLIEDREVFGKVLVRP